MSENGQKKSLIILVITEKGNIYISWNILL
jgi:hypothetical protein